MAKNAFSAVEDFYISGHADEDPKAVAKAIGKPRAFKAVAKRQEEVRAARPKPTLLHTKSEGGAPNRVTAMTEAAAARLTPSESRAEYLERNKGIIHNPNGG